MARSETLTLPLLVSGRDFADDMVDAFARLVGPLSGVHVVVDAGGLQSGTASFAAQLVQRLLDDEDAADLVLVAAPARFAADAGRAAATLGVQARFATAPSLPALAS